MRSKKRRRKNEKDEAVGNRSPRGRRHWCRPLDKSKVMEDHENLKCIQHAVPAWLKARGRRIYGLTPLPPTLEGERLRGQYACVTEAEEHRA